MISDTFTGLSDTPQRSETRSYLSLNHQSSAQSLTCGRNLEMIHIQMNEWTYEWMSGYILGQFIIFFNGTVIDSSDLQWIRWRLSLW